MMKGLLLKNCFWNFLDEVEYRHGERFARRAATIDKVLLKSSSGDLLEAGCGNGRFLRKLMPALRVRSIRGVDINAESIKQAYAAGFGVILANAEKLPFKNCSFDTVMSANGSVQYMDWQTLLSEASRVLRPGGVFGFDTYNKYPVEKVLKYKLMRFLKTSDSLFTGIPGGIKDIAYLRKTCQDAGFQIKALYTLIPLPLRPYGILIRGSLFCRMHTHLVAILKK